MIVCTNCGEENPDRARFCMACTNPLSTEAPEGSRRIVTIVFSDLVGSTALGERLDPEALRELLDRYFDAMRSCLERHGGVVEKYIGDAIMAVFGLARTREDDALRAVRAAAEMRATLAELNRDLEARWGVRLANRTGIYTGEIVAGDAAAGQRLVTGDAVNTAARLEQAAGADEVLVGDTTHRLVRHAGSFEEMAPVEAKGKAEAVHTYRLVAVGQAPAIPRRVDARLVGRASEVSTLNAALADAFERGGCGFALVSGEPGVGKTRLVAEVAGSSEAVVLRGRCLSYGEDVAFWALAEAIRGAARIQESESADEAMAKLEALCAGAADAEEVALRLASAMGLSSQAFPSEEALWALRRVVEHLSSSSPVLLVLDDVHWADPVVLDAVAHLVFFATQARVMILASARPEFLASRRSWVAELGGAVVELEPLSEHDTSALVRGLVGGVGLSREVLGRVERQAQGNPLFVEQIVAMWLDEGLLVAAENGWTLASDAPEIPSSIRTLLAARLSGLSVAERTVLERGSVMGLEFPGEAVIALGGTPIHEPLLELKSKRFVRERGIDEWAFVHVLIRDAAYEGMLKRTRATLHERFADWLDARDRSAELTEIVAYHLEQAYLLGLELGAVDEHLADVGRRAASLLERSALRARDRTLAAITSSLFERAARCADGEERADLLSRALEAATGAQELGRAKAILRELRSGELPMSESSRARVRLAELDVEAAGAHADRAAEAAAVAESARGRGDDEVLSGALRLVARYSAWSGGLRYARQASTESVGAARRSGRRDHEVEALAHVAGTSIFDGDPIDRSVETCLAALAERPDDRTLELALVRPLTVLLHMQGRLDEADRALERYRQLVDELGPTFLRINMISEAESMRAGIERDPIAMERAIRPAYERLAAAGEKELLSSYSATLAHALVGQGRLDEAMTLSEESEQISAEDDYDAQTRWRSARALVWAAQGRFEEAERLMGEALTIAAGTEDISLHGDTLLDRAMLLRSAGRESEANASIEEAAARFERKGNVRAAQVARLHLEQGS